MTIFGFTLWAAKEENHIRKGQERMGDAFHSIADTLEEGRDLLREQMGLPAEKRAAKQLKAAAK